MDGNDRRAIEDLFEKLSDVERNSPPRDREAEAFIRSAIERAPAAPYYMAQTIIVQQQGLEAAQRRIEELEEGGGRENEGFLSGLFGGGRARQPERRDQRFDQRPPGGPWSQQAQGGGFLAGAAQTAVGVAGGILLGNMIAGAFGGGSAHAAENDRSDDKSGDDKSGNDRSDDDDRSDNDAGDSGDSGSDFADAGGDFGGGDF